MIRAFFELIKPRPTFLALVAAALGGYMALPHWSDIYTLFHLVLGAFFVGAGANAWNQIYERHTDRLMKRTHRRPLPSGRLHVWQAVLFAFVMSVGGVVYLFYRTNALTGWVALFLLGTYVGLYTPLKRISRLSLWIGSVSGALPPVMGWTSVRGQLELEALLLFGIVFVWQIPHVMAIAWFYREDYLHVHSQIMELNPQDEHFFRLQILVYTQILFLIGCLPSFVGMTGGFYLMCAVFFGFWFLVSAWRLFAQASPVRTRAVIKSSIYYLSGIMFAMVLDKV